LRQFAATLVLLLIAPAAQADKGTLIVEVRGLEFNTGKLRFAVFDSDENFFKEAVTYGDLDVVYNGGNWVVTDLPFGTYAVTVHHDVNDNGEMEQHWYGKPKEPVGASNNPSTKFGPPNFKKSKFDFASAELTLSVEVR
jgi:uncharacterized protein (DUF2141 family)